MCVSIHLYLLTKTNPINIQVNTASRMESHGEPMKIHISEESANILERFGCFLIEPRGQVDIKGKGIMNTFWLTGRVDAQADSQAIKAIKAT